MFPYKLKPNGKTSNCAAASKRGFSSHAIRYVWIFTKFSRRKGSQRSSKYIWSKENFWSFISRACHQWTCLEVKQKFPGENPTALRWWHHQQNGVARSENFPNEFMCVWVSHALLVIAFISLNKIRKCAHKLLTFNHIVLERTVLSLRSSHLYGFIFHFHLVVLLPLLLGVRDFHIKLICSARHSKDSSECVFVNGKQWWL